MEHNNDNITMNKAPIIQLKNISKVFDSEEVESHVLAALDLSIHQGEYISISGPSGCGKSTLLSILGLLDTPTSGDYYIDGVKVDSLSMHDTAKVRNEKIGFIFQSFNLIDELSVLENVMLPLKYNANWKDKNAIRTQAEECLKKVGLEHRMNHKPNQLSGGQQQRVGIARALVGSPSILLVDEPTGNLDSKSGDLILDVLNQLHAEGTTICLVTHDPRYADLAHVKYKLSDGILETA
jgi:putative ABC transport system ATP-binding protein